MDTYKLYEEIRFDMCYLAQYSTRKGTFADQNLEDDVPKEEKARRWHKLNDLLRQCALEGHKPFEGKTVEVLVEKYENGMCEGRSEHFKFVTFKSPEDLTGKIIKVEILRGREWQLVGGNTW